MGSRARFTAAWTVVLALAASLWWGIHPPRTEDAYRRESATVSERLASHLRTASIWLDTYDAGNATAAATTVALTETETDAQRDASGLAAYQPPNRATTDLRTRVEDLAQQAVTLLGDVRIDARSGRWTAATDAAGELERLADRLMELSREVRP